MKKFWIFALAGIASLNIIANSASAQSILEAGLFSRQTNIGTARATAMAGAFTALGGEISTTTKNPAGVGVFRNSEVTISIAPTFGKSFSTSEDFSSKGKRNSFQLDNLGVVFAIPVDGPFVKYFNIGVNYGNLANYNNESRRIVATSPTSMTHVWAAQSAGIHTEDLNSLSTGLAYNTFLINPDGNGGYYSILDYKMGGKDVTDPVSQDERVREKGFQGDYSITLGANILDKLYVGLGLTAVQTSYQHTSLYREAAEVDALSGLDYYDYHTWEQSEAIGAKISLGFIYRPTNFIRLGAAIHTPTWQEVSYEGDANIEAFYNTKSDSSINREDDWYADYSPVTSYNYNIRTAWRANFGAALVLKQRLILSADAEFVAYSKAKYIDIDDDFYNFETLYSELNQQIRSTYSSKWNFAVGAEYKITDCFSLRYGYNLNRTPYRNALETDLQQHNCGIGWAKGWAMVDLSYSHSMYENTTQFYNWGDIVASQVKNEYKRDIVKLTLGLRF